MKKVILIANDAEACGKTSVAVTLQNWLQRKGLRTKLAVTSIEQELPVETVLLDVEDEVSPGDVIELVDEADVLLVDVHTGGAERFEKFFFRNHLDDALDEIECGLTVVLPVCDDVHVIAGAMDRARAFSRCADFMVAHLPLAADEPEAFATSGARRTLRQMGAVEVTMPGVADVILDELEAMDLDVPLAITQREHLARYTRHQLHAWEVQWGEHLRAAAEILVPDRSREDTRDDAIFGKTLAF